MRLLLAEDEKDLSKAICTILKYNNFSVDAVFNGQDALDYIDSDIYDGVILDIMMPKVDGLTVLKTIRQKGNKIPVIMLTAKAEIDDRCLGLDMGADDYLTKPFSMKELLSRIKAIIRRKEVLTDSILTFGDIKLDRSTYELIGSCETIKLTNKEFQIIEMFMLSPSKVFSIEQLMTKIWGFETESETGVVWVYISGLRKKLKQLNAKVEIKTNRNVGYYLELIDD